MVFYVNSYDSVSGKWTLFKKGVLKFLVAKGMWLRESGATDEMQEARNAPMTYLHVQRMNTKALCRS
jgi:hypothetical protein